MSYLAFIFPGQGSQSPGMLEALNERHPVVAETFAEAGEILGLDLWTMACTGPAEALNATELTQPLMLAGGIAVWRAWCHRDGAPPVRLAGHSLGEFSALVAAGALEFADAVQVTAERARLMQAAVPPGQGAMAAVLGLDEEVVEAICREVAEDQLVAPANYNSPGQLVIAGHAAAVERATRACLEAGARRTLTLPVSVPSHCGLMAPAAAKLAVVLEKVSLTTPTIPVLHNVDAGIRTSPKAIRQALVEQLSAPVRWTDCVRELVAPGVTTVAECGPGKVLCGLGKRINRQVEWLALENPQEMDGLAARV